MSSILSLTVVIRKTTINQENLKLSVLFYELLSLAYQ